jgi:hypothetical protein
MEDDYSSIYQWTNSYASEAARIPSNHDSLLCLRIRSQAKAPAGLAGVDLDSQSGELYVQPCNLSKQIRIIRYSHC